MKGSNNVQNVAMTTTHLHQHIKVVSVLVSHISIQLLAGYQHKHAQDVF